jgi:hypothetical protein
MFVIQSSWSHNYGLGLRVNILTSCKSSIIDESISKIASVKISVHKKEKTNLRISFLWKEIDSRKQMLSSFLLFFYHY